MGPPAAALLLGWALAGAATNSIQSEGAAPNSLESATRPERRHLGHAIQLLGPPPPPPCAYECLEGDSMWEWDPAYRNCNNCRARPRPERPAPPPARPHAAPNAPTPPPERPPHAAHSPCFLC